MVLVEGDWARGSSDISVRIVAVDKLWWPMCLLVCWSEMEDSSICATDEGLFGCEVDPVASLFR